MQEVSASVKERSYRFTRVSWLIILLETWLVGVLWLFVYYQLNHDFNRTMSEASQETMSIARTIEEHVTGLLDNAASELANMKAEYEQAGRISLPLIIYGDAAARYRSRNLVAVLNERGIIVESFARDVRAADRSDLEYFQFHRRSAEDVLYIGRPIIDSTDGQFVIPLSRRLNRPDGKFAGVVYLGLRTSYFLSFFHKVEPGPDQLINLSGLDGVYWASKVGNVILGDGLDEELWLQLQAGSRCGSYLSTGRTDGVRRIVSYRVLEDYPLVVSVGKAEQKALAGYEQRKRNTIFAAAITSLFIILVCGLLINRENKLHAIIEHLKDTQSKLADSEKMYREVVDTACAIIMTTNERGEILYMNNYGLNFFGYAAEELIGRTFYETIIPEYESTGRNLHQEIAARGPKVEAPHYVHENITRSGKRVWVDWSNKVYIDSKTGERCLLSVGIDIHERKLMEEELRRHRDHLQTLVNEQIQEIYQKNVEMSQVLSSISEPFIVLDKEWRLTYVNQAAANLAPQLDQEHLGQIIWDILPDIVDGEFYQAVHEACVTNQPIHKLLKSTIKDLSLESHLYPYDKGILVYLRDVTEQLKYEAELLRLDRLNLVGEMAACLGHEIRNPLTTVRGYLQLFMLKDKYADHRVQFATMIEELDRANGIIAEFLSLAKNKTVELRPGNINTILEALFPLLQAEAYHLGHVIKMDLGNTPDIMLNNNEMRQLVLNLVNNGLEAMSEAGQLHIKTYVENDKVVMSVADCGEGIPQEVRDKLGTPFVTTKEKGNGLGLAVCYRIAQRHGAKIDFHTSPAGTTFYVQFNI